MLFGGDVMQHLPQVEAARSGEGFDYTPVFAALAPRMHAADLAVVNLETTLTRSGRYTGYPLFRSPAELADALRGAGVMSLSWPTTTAATADAEGIRTTIRELDRCGIRHTGVFADSARTADTTRSAIDNCRRRTESRVVDLRTYRTTTTYDDGRRTGPYDDDVRRRSTASASVAVGRSGREGTGRLR